MVVLRADLGLVAPSDDVPRHSRARLTAFPRRETASLSEHIGPTDQLIANRQSALSQEILDIPVAESKPEIEPDSVPDDVWRKSVVGIGNGLHGLNC
jgi:hypothetical protein